MVTKAELEAELAALKAELAARPDTAGPDDGGQSGDSPADEPPAAEGAEPEEDTPRIHFKSLLSGQGLDTEEVKALWEQLAEELEGLPQKKPVLTMLGAFALGVAVGRMSK